MLLLGSSLLSCGNLLGGRLLSSGNLLGGRLLSSLLGGKLLRHGLSGRFDLWLLDIGRHLEASAPLTALDRGRDHLLSLDELLEGALDVALSLGRVAGWAVGEHVLEDRGSAGALPPAVHNDVEDHGGKGRVGGVGGTAEGGLWSSRLHQRLLGLAHLLRGGRHVK